GKPLTHDADDGAVLRGDLCHVVGGRDAAAARHVDDHELRIARNVLAHEAGEEPRILVVVAAGCGAYHHANLLALVEIGHRLGERGARYDRQGEHAGKHRSCDLRHRV